MDSVTFTRAPVPSRRAHPAPATAARSRSATPHASSSRVPGSNTTNSSPA
jgi:hypothetical protein